MRFGRKAEDFSAFLDGVSGAPADPETEKDLAVARLLRGADPSAQTGLKERLRERLVALEAEGGTEAPARPRRPSRIVRIAVPAGAAAAVLAVLLPVAVPHAARNGGTGPAAAQAGESARIQEMVQLTSGGNGKGEGGGTGRSRDRIADGIFVMPQFPSFEEAEKRLKGRKFLKPSWLPDGVVLTGVSVFFDRSCVALFRGAAGNALILWETEPPQSVLSGPGKSVFATDPDAAEPSEKVPFAGGEASWMRSEGYGQLSWTSGSFSCRLSGIGLELEQALRIASGMR